MHRTYKLLCAFLALSLVFLVACATPARETSDVPIVMTTNFPLYDFARAVGGDAADVRMLLPPSMEAHVYDPSPQDIIAIGHADILLYGGDALEPWVARLMPATEGSGVAVVDASQGSAATGHTHEDEHDHGAYHDEDHAHEHGDDPHIWLDPHLAEGMVDAVQSALTAAAPEHAALYAANADAYREKLEELDEALTQATQNAAHPMLFAGRYAFTHLAERYGLEAIAALDSCGAEAEPSAQRIALMVDTIKAQNLGFILREAWDGAKTADAIAAQTGVKTLVVYGCHNVTRQQLDDGVTYLELMHENARVLGEVLP